MLTPLISNLPRPTVAAIDRPHSQSSTIPSSETLHSPESSECSSSTLATTVSDISKPDHSLQVLLAIRLEDDYFIDDNEDDGKKLRTWCDWLKNIPEGAENITIQGVYKSCSALVILSLPIALWDLLPNEAAYSFIGFVNSNNLANAMDKPDLVPETALSYLKPGLTTRAMNVPNNEAPITFADAVGRTFIFPFHLCQTWVGFEKLVKEAFIYVEIIGPHVVDGHYDLLDSNQNFILPTAWESLVYPGWEISMHMWPMPGIPSKYWSSYLPRKTRRQGNPGQLPLEIQTRPTHRRTSSNYVAATAGLRSKELQEKMLQLPGYYTPQSSLDSFDRRPFDRRPFDRRPFDP